MGYEVKKTEHAGPKRGTGAFWGRKREAKKERSRTRRKNWQQEIWEEVKRETGDYDSGVPMFGCC